MRRSIRGKRDSRTIFDPISTYKRVRLWLIIINESNFKAIKPGTESGQKCIKFGSKQLFSTENRRGHSPSGDAEDVKDSRKVLSNVQLHSHAPPHIPSPLLCLSLLSLPSCLPPSFPLLSMKRTQVINQEQRAGGLHGPGAHYVPHNRLEAWTCCE